MASMYVNKRLELKKNALLRKGAGRFFTIEGKVDEAVGDRVLGSPHLVGEPVLVALQLGFRRVQLFTQFVHFQA